MSRPIFRESALRRYNERLEKVELPRYATPPWARLWLVCGLLLAVCAGLLWAADVPVYAAGAGFVGAEQEGKVEIIALFPPEFAPRLAVGQTVQVSLSGSDGEAQAIGGAVVAIEGQLLSPATAQARFPLLADVPESPVAVVHAMLDAAALPGATSDLWQGSRAEVRVTVGAQSGLALLPGVGPLLAGDY